MQSPKQIASNEAASMDHSNKNGEGMQTWRISRRDRTMSGRGIVCAWLFSSLIGCALPAAPTQIHGAAQEVVGRSNSVIAVEANRRDQSSQPGASENGVSGYAEASGQPSRPFQGNDRRSLESSYSDLQSSIGLVSYQRDAESRSYRTPTPASMSPYQMYDDEQAQFYNQDPNQFFQPDNRADPTGRVRQPTANGTGEANAGGKPATGFLPDQSGCSREHDRLRCSGAISRPVTQSPWNQL